jgi:hypothetical protein
MYSSTGSFAPYPPQIYAPSISTRLMRRRPTLPQAYILASTSFQNSTRDFCGFKSKNRLPMGNWDSPTRNILVCFSSDPQSFPKLYSVTFDLALHIPPYTSFLCIIWSNEANRIHSLFSYRTSQAFGFLELDPLLLLPGTPPSHEHNLIPFGTPFQYDILFNFDKVIEE